MFSLKSGLFWKLQQHAEVYVQNCLDQAFLISPPQHDQAWLSPLAGWSLLSQWRAGFRTSNCNIPDLNNSGSWPQNSYFRIPSITTLLGRALPSAMTCWPCWNPSFAFVHWTPGLPHLLPSHPAQLPWCVCLSVSYTARFSLSQPVLQLSGNAHNKSLSFPLFALFF